MLLQASVRSSPCAPGAQESRPLFTPSRASKVLYGIIGSLDQHLLRACYRAIAHLKYSTGDTRHQDNFPYPSTDRMLVQVFFESARQRNSLSLNTRCQVRLGSATPVSSVQLGMAANTCVPCQAATVEKTVAKGKSKPANQYDLFTLSTWLFKVEALGLQHFNTMGGNYVLTEMPFFRRKPRAIWTQSLPLSLVA